MTLRCALVLAIALGSAGCAATTTPTASVSGPPTKLEGVGQLTPALPFPKGYLDPAALPDSLALLPPPPAAGSAAKAADQGAYQDALLVAPDRQALAASDADLGWPHMAQSFEPILGASLTDGSKPHTAMLLRRAAADAALSTYRAKNRYQRTRPFVENKVGTCTPQDEAMLRGDGSYPSGHTAIGWMMALVLVDLVPEKQDAILKRGYAFGESRIVCRAHWLSDTIAGRVMASATFARVQADPVFQAQLQLARKELAQK